MLDDPFRICLLLLVTMSWACAADGVGKVSGSKRNSDRNTSFDGGSPEGLNGGVYADLATSEDACSSDGADEMPSRSFGCSNVEKCDDGLDNNCNGMIDEDCICQPGQVQRCFLGPPARRGVGVCVDGMQTCQGGGEFGNWGVCMGGVTPSSESCNNADDDCDGRTDDGLCCHGDGRCPSGDDPKVPIGKPFETYTLKGSTFFPEPALAWHWNVEGGPCDQMLFATRQHISYKVMGASSMEPKESDKEDLELRPTLSGDYTVTLKVTPMDGPPFECTFIIKIRAPGFRAELCWDTTGDVDLDLWLHNPRNTGDWDQRSNPSNADTCTYLNCKNGDRIPWGYPATLGSACHMPTPAGCENPRLDIDNIRAPGIPENINLDVPRHDDIFRVAVYFFESNVGYERNTHPMVNIYCGGVLRATYGGVMVDSTLYGSTPLSNFDWPGDSKTSSLWRVVDVHMNEPEDTCDLAPLSPHDTRTGACVTTGLDRTFSGPCERRF